MEEEAYSIIIKVKYGDVLRRFSSWIFEHTLGVDMDGLKEKIHSLFKLPPNSALTLTYIDEDGDEVMLVDDDDLRAIAKQVLDPLRITVKLSDENNGKKFHSSGTPTPTPTPFPLESSLVQKPSQDGKTAPESICETLVKLSTDLASTSTPDFNELAHYFSEVSSSYLDSVAESRPRMQSPTHNFVMKDSETSKADAAQSMVPSNVGSEECIIKNEILEKLELLATAIEDALKLRYTSTVPKKVPFATVQRDTGTINAGQPVVSDSLPISDPTAKSRAVHGIAGEKEKVEQTSECCSMDKSSLRSSQHPSVPKKGWVAGMSDVSSNVRIETAISPEPELDLLNPNPSSKRNASVSPLHPACGAVTVGRKGSHNDNLSKICHDEYFCDGCGADPIFGPRFRSKVKEDYDLCNICFSGKAKDSDYIRIDRPKDDHNQVFDF
ncbi:protein JOKA2-like isoform X2 [Henckelia pumila]